MNTTPTLGTGQKAEKQANPLLTPAWAGGFDVAVGPETTVLAVHECHCALLKGGSCDCNATFQRFVKQAQ